MSSRARDRLVHSAAGSSVSALREEFHRLVDELPEERLAPVLQLVRDYVRRSRAIAALEVIQERMSGVAGADEELSVLRDGG